MTHRATHVVDRYPSALSSAYWRPTIEVHAMHGFLLEQANVLLDWTLSAELDAFLESYALAVDGYDRPAVVRNGYQPVRELLTTLGPVTIRVPKVRSRIEVRAAFHSALARPYQRRARTAIDQAPMQFLRALSGGNIHSALAALMGPGSAALRPVVIQRLIQRWESWHREWIVGSLATRKLEALWVNSIDGKGADPAIASPIVVAVGVQDSAHKHLLGVVDGNRDNPHSWWSLLRSLRQRGLPAPLPLRVTESLPAPIRAAVLSVYPETQ